MMVSNENEMDSPNDGVAKAEDEIVHSPYKPPVIDEKGCVVALNQPHEGEHRGDLGKSKIRPSKMVVACAFSAALHSCYLGFDMGVSTGAGAFVKSDFGLGVGDLEFFYGCLNLFATFGSLLAYWVKDRYGRLNAFVLASSTIVFGLVLLTTATNYGNLVIGRSLIGLGIGIGYALDSIYIAEISPASCRGEMVTWTQIALGCGMILGFSTGIIHQKRSEEGMAFAWRFMYGLGIVFPMLVVMLSKSIMLESPRWLVGKCREEEATRILQQIYPDNYDVAPIIADIKEAITRDFSAGKTMSWGAIFCPSPSIRRALLVGVGVAIAQTAVGIDAIIYFLNNLLDEAFIFNPARNGVLIVLGIIKLACTIIGSKLYDRMGRRPLLLLSLSGMAIALFTLSIIFFVGTPRRVLTVCVLALYLGSFGIGMAAVTWIIAGEVFPTSIRSKAMCIAVFANRATATVMTTTFLSDVWIDSYGGFFMILFMVCLIAIAYFYFLLPETKGRSLEDMAVYFAVVTGDRHILDAEARLAEESGMTSPKKASNEGGIMA